MELISDAEGHAAPRLNDIELTPERALDYHAQLLQQVVSGAINVTRGTN